MRCPKCGSRDLRIGVVLAGEVDFRFHEDSTVEPLNSGDLDSFWGPDAECSCPQCQWKSVALMAADQEDDFLRMLPYSDHQLLKLEQLLETGELPADISLPLNELCAVLRQQSAILRSLHRIVSQRAEGSARDHSPASP